jgi:hypothetical protein
MLVTTNLSKDLGDARLRRLYAVGNAHCLETRLTQCALNRGIAVSTRENSVTPAPTTQENILNRRLRAF